MVLISEDYRALNSQLHHDSPAYGSYGNLWADLVTEIAGIHDLKTILDYGCGKGLLKQELPGFDVREYDPAIPEKSDRPKPADMVVCLDVLEHVEPDCLDEVIKDLSRCAKSYLLVNIAMRPSEKTLSDGRNAHLLVEDDEWWHDRLQPYFLFCRWEVAENGGSVVGLLQPYRELRTISSKCAVGHEERQRQVFENIKRCKDRLISSPKYSALPKHDRKAILVCFGPSLLDTWQTAVLESYEDKADLFTVSAAHKFMVEHGYPPFAHMDCDPRSHKVSQIGEPSKQTEYWLASCVHPSYLDLLEGHKVKLWHAYNGERSMEILEHEPNQRMIVGGGSIGVRAMSLLYYLGYRKFSIHGMDCSFHNGIHYAGEHHGKSKDVMPIKIGDRDFETNAAFVVYARYFINQSRWMKGADIHLHGDGLLRHMVSVSQQQLS